MCVLIPGASDYATLPGKKDFTDVMKIEIFRQGDYLRIIQVGLM